jgi:hypothetical protein
VSIPQGSEGGATETCKVDTSTICITLQENEVLKEFVLRLHGYRQAMEAKVRHQEYLKLLREHNNTTLKSPWMDDLDYWDKKYLQYLLGSEKVWPRKSSC